jgi:hypothetical protein
LLFGIGRDDFKIVFFTEREQGVPRAASGMNAAERSLDADMFFNEVDPTNEIAATEKDVVEQSGHLIGSKRREWRGQSASNQSKK